MLKESFTYITRFMELIGVLVILGGTLVASFTYMRRASQKAEGSYELLRKSLGRSILLGLEFLVAADIINTVGVKPTLKSVLVLGLIVLIRTFLSFSIEVEIERRLPWIKPN